MKISKERKQDIDRILDIKKFELERSAGACGNEFPDKLLDFALADLRYSKYLSEGEQIINRGYMTRSLIQFHTDCKISKK